MSAYTPSQYIVSSNTVNIPNETQINLPNETQIKKNIYIKDEEITEVDNTNIIIGYKDSTGKYIYMIFHIIMAFVAVFLSWKCNGGKFDLLTFLIALFFPYIYIIFILATRGTCDRL